MRRMRCLGTVADILATALVGEAITVVDTPRIPRTAMVVDGAVGAVAGVAAVVLAVAVAASAAVLPAAVFSPHAFWDFSTASP